MSGRTLATVVLLHRTADGAAHYDWMVESPTAGEATGGGDDSGDRVLATWRADREPGTWRAGERVAIERIGDHRRVYLEYEGPLPGAGGTGADRGRVDRVDAGEATAMAWTADYALLDVRLGGLIGRVELRRVEGEGEGGRRGAGEGGGERWTAVVLERRGGADMMGRPAR